MSPHRKMTNVPTHDRLPLEAAMADSSQATSSLSAEALAHYDRGLEGERLVSIRGQLELVRTQELVERYLPPPPAVIFDVGGGAGIYSFWLAAKGYEVHLIDAVPLHIKQAGEVAHHQPNAPLASMAVGDARQLERMENSVDVVLLLGPLYHLIEREDRITALREARRILRPGGVVLAVGISRFISTITGLSAGWIGDPDFVPIMERDLEDGQHRNSTNHPLYFTTAFFHHPEELKTELIEAGFHHEALLAIEGLGRLLANFEKHWQNPVHKAWLLKTLRLLENEPSLLGLSSHILAVGRKERSGE